MLFLDPYCNDGKAIRFYFSSLILSILGKMKGCLKRFDEHSMTKILKTEKLKSRLVHSEIFER